MHKKIFFDRPNDIRRDTGVSLTLSSRTKLRSGDQFPFSGSISALRGAFFVVDTQGFTAWGCVRFGNRHASFQSRSFTWTLDTRTGMTRSLPDDPIRCYRTKPTGWTMFRTLEDDERLIPCRNCYSWNLVSLMEIARHFIIMRAATKRLTCPEIWNPERGASLNRMEIFFIVVEIWVFINDDWMTYRGWKQKTDLPKCNNFRVKSAVDEGFTAN